MILFSVHGSIQVDPINDTFVGQTVRIRCTTSDPDQVTWQFKSEAAFRPETIYTSGQFQTSRPSSERYSVQVNTSSGHHDLVITNVKLHDAGEYICVGKDSQTASSILTVESTYLIINNFLL